MYISKFSAFNFRSLKFVNISLNKDKNVIVGKNNCGKSNIIRGLEILTGERMPGNQNITEKDFYTFERTTEDGEVIEEIAANFYIEATLEERDFNTSLIETIKKKTPFYKTTNGIKTLYSTSLEGGIEINYALFQNLESIDESEDIEAVKYSYSGEPIKADWKSPEALINFLLSAKLIKIFYCKSRLDDERAGHGLIIQDVQGSVFLSGYLSKKLKDSILTTTVISASRSQKEDLKILDYTWYGKLISSIWNKNKILKDDTGSTYNDIITHNAFFIEQYVNLIFAEDTEKIKRLLEGAIAHNQITFKFFNDQKNEYYKNVQVFVNDGINRPLTQKGTGIQSAVIIALFTLYCNQYHSNSSLLIAEEPELYLHPQARRVISAEFNKYLKGDNDRKRQLIISTHSIEYLKNVDPGNIIRVYKDTINNCTVAKQLNDEVTKEIDDELKRFMWSNNAELFFADKVVLVEGGEVYLLPAIIDLISEHPQILDYKNISVTRVNGKGNFIKYIKMLNCFDIKYWVLGDLDCFKDEVFKLIKLLNIEGIEKQEDHIKAILRRLPVNYGALNDRILGIAENFDAQRLKILFERFNSKSIENDDEDLLSIIRHMQNLYVEGNVYKQIEHEGGLLALDEALTILRNNHIFIWSKGALEDYYSEKLTLGKGSKDTRALELSYRLQIPEAKLEDNLKYIDELQVLCECILSD